MEKEYPKSYLKFATSVRGNLSIRKIKKEERHYSSVAPIDFGETTMLEVLPLYEAISDSQLQCGYGISYLIRTDHSTILMDMGNNPDNLSPSPLENNMSKSGISFKDLDCIVFSHRHPDHVGGMKWWKRKSFSPNGEKQYDLSFLPIYTPEKISYPGIHPVILEKPKVIAKGVCTTGSFTFFESYPQGYFLPRDCEQSLVIQVKNKGIFLIVGCGHMGVETLIRRVKQLFKQPVAGIIGGLHYGKKKKEELQQEINIIKEISPELLALSPHDSYPETLKAFECVFSDAYQTVKAGKIIIV